VEACRPINELCVVIDATVDCVTVLFRPFVFYLAHKSRQRQHSFNMVAESATGNLVLAFIFAAGLLLIGWLLSVVWAREQVKKDLRKKGSSPIHVRWCPFGYWAQLYEIAFLVTLVDAAGCVQTTRCSVFNLDFSVNWIGDEVTYLDKNLPPFARVLYLLIAGALVWFGFRYIIAGELILSGSYMLDRPVHFRGWPLLLLCLAGFSLAASFLLELSHCYDQRGRERIYTLLTRGLKIASWMLLVSSVAGFMYQSW